MSRVRTTIAGSVVGITKFVKRQRILTRRRCLQRKFISLSISNPVASLQLSIVELDKEFRQTCKYLVPSDLSELYACVGERARRTHN